MKNIINKLNQTMTNMQLSSVWNNDKGSCGLETIEPGNKKKKPNMCVEDRCILIPGN